MIQSHNTYTYLPARHKLWELLAPWWRCQRHSYGAITEADVLDIRLRRQRNGVWTLCHGLIDLGKHPLSTDLCEAVKMLIPTGKTARVVLERGSDNDRRLFIKHIDTLADDPKLLGGAFIKSPWQTVLPFRLNCIHADFTYKPWDTGLGTWANIRRIIRHPGKVFTTISRYARRHKPSCVHQQDPHFLYHFDML